MELDSKWKWGKRQLKCRVRPETGNPAGDDLRERLAELAGADLGALLTDMKVQKKKREEKDRGVSVDYEAEKKFKEVLGRSHILGASKFAIDEMVKVEKAAAETVTQKNLKKVFARIPESPPKRVLLEIQRERSKPLRLPDQDEMAAASAKLEKKLEKEYRKRREAIEASEREEEAKRKFASGFDQSIPGHKYRAFANSFKPYTMPDLFSSQGPYLGSMLYLSRNAHTMNKSHRISGQVSDDPDMQMGVLQAALLAQEKREEEEHRRKKEEEANLAALSSDSNVNDLGAKVYCAAALCNWSRNASNAARLATEGGVRAMIQLSVETDPRIARYCAASFRFMSEHAVLSSAIIDEPGAVAIISDLVKSTQDDFITTNLCIALVNLTMVNGRESNLVDGTIVTAFTHIVSARPDLAALCTRGLYNLTCVDNSYPLIDRVIRYLVSLSSSSASSVKHICASALCNLSDLKQMRGRLVEESVCSALSSLCRNTPTRTRRVCAVVLQNLSATKSCRVELVIRSAVHVAHSLSHDSDPIILRCVGLTLARLSMEAVNCPRIIQEYGIAALSNIAQKFPSVPGISQPVATAFQQLASRPGIRVQAVQEGCVTAIAALMRASQDPFTLQNSIYALCLLLVDHENHLPIVQQGLLITLVALSAPSQTNEQVKHLCALAFLNLSKSEESHKHMVNAGSITALIQLSAAAALRSSGGTVTRRRCANALCNVSAYESGMQRMVTDGIVPALVGLLSDDIQTIHYACAALCRICTCVENAMLIVDAGAVPNLVQYALKGEKVTKQFCGAVLSTLSTYASCRAMLCEMGCISALKVQSELADEISQLRCLVAFANISCEQAVQPLMVSEGVVEIIAKLIANSYHEKNYTCCAKALCNLACSPASRLAVAKGGGIQALMLISMVHSVNKETKLLCVQALDNLLDDSTVSFMLDEGLTTSLANLCKIEDPSNRVAHLCAKMFNQLSQYQEALYRIVERSPVTSAIYIMAESSHVGTALLSCRTTANLVLCGGPVCQKAVANGALRVLERGILLEDREAASQCVNALFASAQEPAFLPLMARSTLPLSLVAVAKKAASHRGGENDCNTAVMTLSLLAHDANSRPFLQTRDIAAELLDLARRSDLPASVGQWVAYSLRFLSNGYGNSMELIQLGVLSALQALHALEGSGNECRAAIAKCAAETLRCIASASDACAHECAAPNTLDILYRAVLLAAPGSGSGPTADNANTLANAAHALYCITSSGSPARIAMATEDAVPLLCALAKAAASADMTIATIYMMLNDPKTRYTFANENICMAIAGIIEMNKSNDCIYNCVTAVYALSRLPACLDMLSRPGISLDAHLLRISALDDDKLKANCARAMKNLTSDSTEAIEEGAVAALIAMSLEGKSKATKVSDEIVPPLPYLYQKPPQPPCIEVKVDATKHMFVVPKVVTAGGEADTAIEHPDPPLADDVQEEVLYAAEDLDGPDSEVRAKMAFAKMHVPAEVKETHLLKDEDFIVKEDDDDDAEPETGGSGGNNIMGGGEGGTYEAYDDNGNVIRLTGSSDDAAEEKEKGPGQNSRRDPSSARNSPKGSKSVTPISSPKGAARKSLNQAQAGGASGPNGPTAEGKDSETPPGSPKTSPMSMRKSNRGKGGEASGGGDADAKGAGAGPSKKASKGERDMKAQASQLGLYK